MVAIEPNPEAFSQIEAHVTLNRLENVVAVRLALAERSGTARFAVSVRAPMVSRFLNPWETVPPDGSIMLEGPAETLDDLCGRLGLERIDLLKVDVEQAEAGVMTGAPMTLARTRRLVVECLEDTRAMVRDLLRARGFMWRGDVGTVSYFDRQGSRPAGGISRALSPSNLTT